jgi:hypothetical protein
VWPLAAFDHRDDGFGRSAAAIVAKVESCLHPTAVMPGGRLVGGPTVSGWVDRAIAVFFPSKSLGRRWEFGDFLGTIPRLETCANSLQKLLQSPAEWTKLIQGARLRFATLAKLRKR